MHNVRSFVGPLFSWSYELLFPYALCFQNDLRCPPGGLPWLPWVKNSPYAFNWSRSVFSVTCGLFCALRALFAHARLCFSAGYRLLCKSTGRMGVNVDEGATVDARLAGGDACGIAGRVVAEHCAASRRSRGSVLRRKMPGWHRHAASGLSLRIAD